MAEEIQVVRAPVLGELRPHPSCMEGSPFLAFESQLGIDGLAYVDGTELHLLSVNARFEGIGYFRRFMQACKQNYSFIRCWVILNPDMRKVLAAWGFTQGHDVDRFGAIQEVWDWKAPAG